MSSPASDALEGQGSGGESSGSSGATGGEGKGEEGEVEKQCSANGGEALAELSAQRHAIPLPSALPPSLLPSSCPPSTRILLSLQGKVGEKVLERWHSPLDPPHANDPRGFDEENEEAFAEAEAQRTGGAENIHASHRSSSAVPSASSLPALRGHPLYPTSTSGPSGRFAGAVGGVEPYGSGKARLPPAGASNTTRPALECAQRYAYPPHHTSLPMHAPPPRYHNFYKGTWPAELASAAKGRGKSTRTSRKAAASSSSLSSASLSPHGPQMEANHLPSTRSPVSSAPPSTLGGPTSSSSRKHTRVYFASTDRTEKAKWDTKKEHDGMEATTHGVLAVPLSPGTGTAAALVGPPSSAMTVSPSSPAFITATSLLSREMPEHRLWTPPTTGPLSPPPKMSLWPLSSARHPPPALRRLGVIPGEMPRGAAHVPSPSRAPLALQVEAFIRKEHRQFLLHHPGCTKVETLEIFREAFRALAEHFSEYRAVLNLIQDEYEAALTEVEGEVKQMRIIDLENKSDRSLHAMELANVKESLNATISNQRAELLSARGLIRGLREELIAAENARNLLRHELRENSDDRVHRQEQVQLLHSALIEEANNSAAWLRKLKAKDKDMELLQSCVKVLREEVEELHLALMEQLHIAMDQRQQLANMRAGRGDGSFSSVGSGHAGLFRAPPPFPLSFNTSATSMPNRQPSALPFLGTSKAMDALSVRKEMEHHYAHDVSSSGSGGGKRKKKGGESGGGGGGVAGSVENTSSQLTSLRGDGDRKVDLPASPGSRDVASGNTYPELYVVSLLARIDTMAWDLAQWKQKAQSFGGGAGAMPGDDPFSLLRSNPSRWSQVGFSAFSTTTTTSGGGGGGGGEGKRVSMGGIMSAVSTGDDESPPDRRSSGVAVRRASSMENSTAPESCYSSAVTPHGFFLSSPSRYPSAMGGLAPPPLPHHSRSNSTFGARGEEGLAGGVSLLPSTPLHRREGSLCGSRPGEGGHRKSTDAVGTSGRGEIDGGRPGRRRESEGRRGSQSSLLLPPALPITSTYRTSSFSVDRRASSLFAASGSHTATALAMHSSLVLPPEVTEEWGGGGRPPRRGSERDSQAEGADRRSSSSFDAHASMESGGFVPGRSASVLGGGGGGRHHSRLQSFTIDTPSSMSATSAAAMGASKIPPTPPSIASDAGNGKRAMGAGSSSTSFHPVPRGGGEGSPASIALSPPRPASSVITAAVVEEERFSRPARRKKLASTRKREILERQSRKKVPHKEGPVPAAGEEEEGGGNGGGNSTSSGAGMGGGGPLESVESTGEEPSVLPHHSAAPSGRASSGSVSTYPRPSGVSPPRMGGGGGVYGSAFPGAAAPGGHAEPLPLRIDSTAFWSVPGEEGEEWEREKRGGWEPRGRRVTVVRNKEMYPIIRSWLNEEGILDEDLALTDVLLPTGLWPGMDFSLFGLATPVKHLHLTLPALLTFLERIWTEREEKRYYTRLPTYFISWLEKEAGGEYEGKVLGVNMVDVCQRHLHDPDCYVFLQALRGFLSEEIAITWRKAIRYLQHACVNNTHYTEIGEKTIHVDLFFESVRGFFPEKPVYHMLQLRFCFFRASGGNEYVVWPQLLKDRSVFIQTLKRQTIREIETFTLMVVERIRAATEANKPDQIQVKKVMQVLQSCDDGMPDYVARRLTAEACLKTVHDVAMGDAGVIVGLQVVLNRFRSVVLLRRSGAPTEDEEPTRVELEQASHKWSPK